MASNLLPSSSTPTTIPNSFIQSSSFPKTSQLSIFKTKKHYYFVPNKVVSCKATKGNQNNGDSSLNRFDRRDVLVGLGGLYGATNLGNDPFALAAPIQAPDLNLCGEATITGSTEKVACCPPTPSTIMEFKPPNFSKIRYRPAAHLVDPDYLAKFTKAMELMKALPDDDPRSFKQQAYVHCAYCNGAYDQIGYDKDIQVHFSWLFQPFHRLYLYFYERILGKMIDDPDFAMPFWNWDAPAGMPIPAIYVNPHSPLYDEKRNEHHHPPKVVDLNWDGSTELSNEDLVRKNLKQMYKEMVCATSPSCFHGRQYCAGSDPNPGAGSVEYGSHTSIHKWCGDRRQPNKEDMGNFYSAGYDPLFYALHTNVDRMWSIWKELPGKKRIDFTDSDWLDSSFVFYDENKNLVRCKVRDCLDTKTLGYDYQRGVLPWLRAKPFPRKFSKKGRMPNDQEVAAEIKNKNVIRNAFPIVLDKTVSIEIPRQKKTRTRLEKEDEEVLVIEGIQLDRDVSVKVDVHINDEDDEAPAGPEDSEFAGTFSNLPHNHKHGKKFQTSLILPISCLLKDLDVEGDDSIVVTLVPKEGKGLVTVGNIKIDYIQE